MRLQVKGKNIEVSDSIRSYAEEKLARLERQLADPTKVELELALERNPSIADNHVAEATIWTKGPTLRARETSHDMRASIDQLVDKLERQVTRYREKRQRKHGRDSVPLARPAAVEDVERSPERGRHHGGVLRLPLEQPRALGELFVERFSPPPPEHQVRGSISPYAPSRRR